MSSYVTSPFVLEQRRLQGILNQCQDDLYNALQEVEKQQEIMKQKEEEQYIKDAQYFVFQRGAENRYQRDIEKKQKEWEQRRSGLENRIRRIKIELGAVTGDRREWKEIIDRQEQLTEMILSRVENLDDLEQYIDEHEQNIRIKTRQISEVLYGKAMYESGHIAMKRSHKGISLKMGDVYEKIEKKEQSPLDIFIFKMREAMESKYINRFPALIKLEKEFDEQQDYMKPLFAVQNMEKLVDIRKQIEQFEKNESEQARKRKEIILRYRAICRMMGIKENESLIEERKSSRNLIKTCNELYQEYQEKKKQQYIISAIEEVMERHGIAFQDSTSSAWGSTLHFSMDHAQIDISGAEDNQLTMEVYGEYEGTVPTLDDRRKSVVSANKICSLLQVIETELREEHGIIFGKTIIKEPCEEAIIMKKAIGRQAEKKHRNKSNKLLEAL